jgi:hypothetical protein
LKNDLDFLFSPEAIRQSAQWIYELSQKSETHFILDESKLGSTVELVIETINKNYPDHNIPFHSRWGHFQVGKIDRISKVNEAFRHKEPMERARCKLDLVITSVLLDAGAGKDWFYFEDSSQNKYSRSEGLALASLYLFLNGTLSRDRQSNQADVDGLRNLSKADIEKYFQVTKTNPLVGVQGRLDLLNNLSRAVERKEFFKDGRPGNIIDYLFERYGKNVQAKAILRAVLDGFGPIWPGREKLNGVNLGDVWKYKGQLVAFHKLSQWMTYSLIEPIVEAGFRVEGVEELTGLAEYRNGGLLIDTGILNFKNSKDAGTEWAPDSELIIEWRALTIYYLDVIAEKVQSKLNKSAKDFPLAKVLEGGTWWAGRRLAQEKRTGGDPPIRIKSDATVF